MQWCVKRPGKYGGYSVLDTNCLKLYLLHQRLSKSVSKSDEQGYILLDIVKREDTCPHIIKIHV